MSARWAASLTATANARPLDEALRGAVDLASSLAAPGARPVVALAIGARPVEDPFAVLAAARAARPDLELVAHHTVPLGPRTVLRPQGDPDGMCAALGAAGIAHYSAHACARREATFDEFWQWSRRWHDALAAVGVSFAVETMYPVRDAAEAEWGSGWHLDGPDDVHRFLDRADRIGWRAPLVVDGAHLHIGRCAGVWDDDAVWALCARTAAHGACAEAHVSANDGVRDRHAPVGAHPDVDAWVAAVAAASGATLVVDEGRRR